jgi:hypothetical protein
MEYWIIGQMLKEGLDVYVPLVDDFGIDAVVRKANNTFIEVQIKARSTRVKDGNSALFAAILHPEVRENYYFIFHSEILQTNWIMSSEEFIAEAYQTTGGKNAGLRTIGFNGRKKNKTTGVLEDYARPQYEKYRSNNFDRFKEITNLLLIPSDA